MKNLKIEKILAESIEAEKAGREETIAQYKKYSEGAWSVIRAYKASKDKGFDEIVFWNDVVWAKNVKDIISFCKEVGINWFVLAGSQTGMMEVIMHFTEAGARVGKFVVKEYDDGFSMKKLPGMRINL